MEFTAWLECTLQYTITQGTGSARYVFINKQLIGFKCCFGIVSWLCQGKS